MKIKFKTRTLAAIMSLVLLIASLPMSVYASDIRSLLEDDTAQASDAELSTDAAEDQSHAITVDPFEVVELRDEYTKYFRDSDGTYVAAQYQTPVHVLDADGTWQDIDNSLTLSGNELSTKDAKIKFAKKLNGNNELFTLSEGNTKLSMSLDGANKKAEGTIITEDESTMTKLQKMMHLEDLNAHVIYTEALDNVDVEYIASNGSIKENIIVKQKLDSYLFSFSLKLNGLYAELSEDGSIGVYNESDDSVKYIIPAPVAYDANGEFADSDEVYYTLTQTGNKKYTLALQVSDEWMNDEDRAYPVTVDPTISLVSNTTSVMDTYVDESTPTTSHNKKTYIAVGSYKNTGHDFVGYWKAPLPEIPDNSYIVDATLSLYCQNYRKYDSLVSNLYIEAYTVLSSWPNGITWNQYINNTYGILDSTPIDYAVLTLDNGTSVRHSWNITEAAVKWYDGSLEYNGIALRQNGTAYNSALLSSCNASSNNPVFSVTYKNNLGLESYWSYASQSAGLAGSGNINYATGALTFTKGLLSTTDSLMPYTPSLTYSSALAGKEYIYPNVQISYWGKYSPLGFKLSLEETVIQKTYQDENGTTVNYYIWSDADGTEHAFLPVRNADSSYSATEFYDEDGLLLELNVLSSSSLTITDKSDTVRTFGKISGTPSSEVLSGWYLTSIKDKNNNKVSFTFASGPIPTVISLTPNEESKIDMLNISYLPNKLPAAIYNEASGEAVIFRYSQTPTGSISATSSTKYLRQIVYAHKTNLSATVDWGSFATSASNNTNITVDATAYYEYDSAGYLTSAKDGLSDYEVRYTYTNGKVTSVKEYAGSTLGQQIGITYFNGYTEVRRSGTDDVYYNADDIITRYVFDAQGRACNVYSLDTGTTRIYGGTSATYEEQANIKNNIKQTYSYNGVSPNYIYNGALEGVSSWNKSGNVVAVNDPDTGDSDVKMSVSANGSATISQKVFLPSEIYTLSVEYHSYLAKGLSLKVKAKSLDTTKSYTKTIPLNAYGADIEDSHETIEIRASGAANGGERYLIEISLVGGSTVFDDGYVIIDEISLTKEFGLSEFNYVNFGGFENSLLDYNTETPSGIFNTIWKKTDGSNITTTDQGYPFNSVLCIDGSITEAQWARQRLDLSLVEGYTKCFAVSAYGKGSAQIGSDKGEFAIVVDVQYMDGTSESFTYDFVPSCNEWQAVNGTFTVDGSKTVDIIYLYCEYSNNPGTAYFDNIKVTELSVDALSSNLYYENGDLRVMRAGTYEEIYEYYENTSKVKRVANNRGQIVDYVYDAAFKNVESTTLYEFTKVDDPKDISYPYSEDPSEAVDAESQIIKTAKTITEYEYNDYGQLATSATQEIKENEPYPLTVSVSYTYNAEDNPRIFGSVSEFTDERGGVTRYFYDSTNGRLLAQLSPKGDGSCYEYDSVGNITGVYPASYTSSTNSYSKVSNAESAEYIYDSHNYLTKITTESSEYNFSYNVFKNKDSVSVGNSELANYEYNQSNGKLKKVNYGNGHAVRYVYDELDRLCEVWYTDNGTETKAYEYVYTSSGQLHKIVNTATNETTQYKYGSSGKLIGTVQYGEDGINDYSTAVTYYNDTSDVHSISFGTDYVDSGYSYPYWYTQTFTYLGDGKIDSVHYESVNEINANVEYKYDGFNRVIEQSYTYSDTVSGYVQYSYFQPNDGYTSSLPSTYRSSIGSNTNMYAYLYDANGNITSVISLVNNVRKQTRYVYDDLGQLIREDNEVLGKTYVYTYDNAGNILTKKTYNLTAANTTPSSPISTYNYSYNDSNWGDKLTSYRGHTITYDEIGNPLSYYNGSSYTFTWEKSRQLATAVKGSQTLSFEYNSDGIRTSKTVNGVEHVYYLNGSQILAESWDNRLMVFIYDASGSPIGFQYRNEETYEPGVFVTYWYIKNLQGDIVAVSRDDGVVHVSYTYDAGGNVTTTYVNGGYDAAAYFNPFKYRGYYHDSETGFYYLNSRYYDPATGRFLNADGLVSTGQGFIGHNMFAYCGNNPVNRVDFSGRLWGSVVFAAVCVVGLVCLLTSCSSNSVGSAPEYKEFGTSDGNRDNNPNCYSYAIGEYEKSYDPGDFSSPFTSPDVDSVAAAVERDMEALGRGCRPLETYNSPISDDEYRIALRVSEVYPYMTPNGVKFEWDYHFMVQTSSGGWAEKHGPDGITEYYDTDNPDTISWDRGDWEIFYSSRTIYFAVTW